MKFRSHRAISLLLPSTVVVRGNIFIPRRPGVPVAARFMISLPLSIKFGLERLRGTGVAQDLAEVTAESIILCSVFLE